MSVSFLQLGTFIYNQLINSNVFIFLFRIPGTWTRDRKTQKRTGRMHRISVDAIPGEYMEFS